MRYMLIMRDTQAAVDEWEELPFEEVLNRMGAFNESMMKAGVLLSAEGLADAKEGSVVDFSSDEPIATDGPYGEIHELLNGFWIIQTSTKEEAIEWAKRAPLGPGSKLEIRRIQEWEDFPDYADNEYVQKESAWREELKQKQ